MAYCRAGGKCDVYMYASILGGYQFHLCRDPIDGDKDFRIISPYQALRRLKRLQVAGWGVPDYAVERLDREIKEQEMKGAIWYKDCWLMPGSQAFKLHQEGDFKKLDQHMKMLEAQRQALEGAKS